MIEVKALKGLEHGGTIKRGEVFSVATRAHADLLVGKRLVEEVESASPVGGDQSSVDGAHGSEAASLVSGNAADVIARVKVATDRQLLHEGLIAEEAKGEAARKTVLEALQVAIEASQAEA